MADGLEPTETLTSFERYNELGVNDDDAGSGDECDQCSQFQISSKLERAEKRGGPCSPLGNRSTQNSDVDDDRDTEDDNTGSGEGLQERVKHLRQQPLERGRLLLTFIKLKMKMAMLTIVSGDEWPHSGNCEESMCSWLLQVGGLVDF